MRSVLDTACSGDQLYAPGNRHSSITWSSQPSYLTATGCDLKRLCKWAFSDAGHSVTSGSSLGSRPQRVSDWLSAWAASGERASGAGADAHAESKTTNPPQNHAVTQRHGAREGSACVGIRSAPTDNPRRAQPQVHSSAHRPE